MQSQNDNDINAEHSLGKGEVLSSILSGSTRNAHETRAFPPPGSDHSAVSGRTPREHDAMTRGKSVDSVHGMHPIEARRALRLWALDKPQHIKEQVWAICGQMWALERVTNPTLRKIAALAIEKNIKLLGTGGEP